MARRDEVPMLEFELLEDIEDSLRSDDMAAIRARIEDIGELQEWLELDKFDRRAVNHQLKQFSANDPAWRLD
jgi:Spy/CpxP family protein refolding chaperone